MPVWLPLLVPAGIAVACLLASWRPWKRRSLAENGHWGGALAFAGAFFAAHVLLLDWPQFPPAQSAEWLVWMAVPLCAIGITQRWWGAKWFAAWPIFLVVSAGVCYALLRSKLENDWDLTLRFVWLAGLALTLAGSWLSLETLAAIRPGAGFPLSMWVWSAGSAAAFTLAGSGAIGQLAAALAVVWGVVVLLAWWAPGLSAKSGALAAFVPLHFGLLMRSYFYSEMSVWSAALLFTAPLVLWYGEQRRFRFTRPWKAALVRMGLIAVPTLIAVGLEWWLKSREESYF